MLNFRILLAALTLGSIGMIATAQDAEPIEEMSEEEARQAYLDWATDILADVTPEQGAIELQKAPIIITLPDTLEFYDAKEARVILENLWENPEDDTPLGMIFPAGQSPAEAPWGALLKYEKTGYVSDDDANEIDFDALLADMQRGTQAANPTREEMGYPTIELVGWADPPRYDAASHRLSWAKDLLFSSFGDHHTLNYDMRVLGRHGVLSINFIADMSSLDEVKIAAPTVLAAPAFKDGSKYADYQEGDARAGYGVAALIAGGAGAAAAKKLGMLGAALLFLKKGWIFIAAGIAFLIKNIGGLFRKSDGE